MPIPSGNSARSVQFMSEGSNVEPPVVPLRSPTRERFRSDTTSSSASLGGRSVVSARSQISPQAIHQARTEAEAKSASRNPTAASVLASTAARGNLVEVGSEDSSSSGSLLGFPIGKGGRQTVTRGSVAARRSLLRAASNILQLDRHQPWWRGIVMFATRPKASLRVINKNKYFQGTMFLALLAALFLPDIWILMNRPDNSDLDIILTIVLTMFLIELAVQSIGLSKTYLGSFFFWMDLLGAASLLLDLSYLPIMAIMAHAGGDSMSGNAVVMRTARIAKLGARAGRATRVMNLLSFLPGVPKEQGANAGLAKRISGRLVSSLSMRVSGLIILMVSIMPFRSMWTFPETDWSLRSWAARLETIATLHPDRLGRQLDRFGSFYADLSYFPYRVEAKTGHGLPSEALQWLPWVAAGAGHAAPERAVNSIRFETENLVCDFNFAGPNQMDALMNVLLLVVVMVLMVGFSLVLSSSVSGIVLRPLENLLLQVHQTGAMIFKSVTDMASAMKNEDELSEEEIDDEQDFDIALAFKNETILLERVVRKLKVMSEARNGEDAEDDKVGLDARDRAMISMFGGKKGVAQEVEWEDDAISDDENDPVLKSQREIVENAGLSLDLLDSWNLNPLELDKARNHAAAMYFLGPHNHGMPFSGVDMGYFLEAVEQGYVRSNPYHNWFHAIDVTHGVYRLLHICSAEHYLSGCDRFALLVGAISHDVGHPGFTNAFLIETSHDLALRYNDRSPLENMHCSRLFEMVSTAKCNIFSDLSKDQRQEVRKVSVGAILYSDNARHFDMIKEIQMCSEVHSELFDESRANFKFNQESFPSKETLEAMRAPESRRLVVDVMLHVADISNSMKPFRICRIWASQVLDEYFKQGDAEKKLGIPVQALNDREKVNRAFSQVGFIEFLVSPLFFTVLKVLPPLENHVEQLILNAKTWHQNWLSDTDPPPSDRDKEGMRERLRKLQNKYLDYCS